MTLVSASIILVLTSHKEDSKTTSENAKNGGMTVFEVGGEYFECD